MPWDARAARRHQPERIEAEAQVDGGPRDTLLVYNCGNRVRDIFGLRPEIELDRDARIQMHALEYARDRSFGRRNAVPVCADRPGKHHVEPARAVLEIV